VTESPEVPTSRVEGEKKSSRENAEAANEHIVAIWRAAGFDSIELHSGSGISQEYPRHWHDELYLCAVMDGAADLHCGGSSLETPPDTLALIPPGEIHANRKFECTFRCMFIDGEALRADVEKFTEQAVPEINFRTELIRGARTVERFLRTHRFLEGAESEMARESAVMLFFHLLVSGHSATSLPRARDGNEDFTVLRIRRYLDERYAERVSLQDLSRFTGISPYHLHRSFCRKIGMPPHSYQTQVRIHHARLMLRQGRSISDVASSSGFVDQSHFARHFKKLTGATPGQYVRLQQDRTRRSFPTALHSVV
jgi:AraC-like DNA-binding protein/mannose-6-phosphate isomerase-like protein (cupin superfamily)